MPSRLSSRANRLRYGLRNLRGESRAFGCTLYADNPWAPMLRKEELPLDRGLEGDAVLEERLDEPDVVRGHPSDPLPVAR